MKALTYTITVMVIVTQFFTGCTKNIKCGEEVERTFPIEALDELHLTSSYTVKIFQSDSSYLNIRGCSNDFDNLDLNNTNGVLKISRGNRQKNNQRMDIVMGIPEWKVLKTNGDVDVELVGFETYVHRIIKTEGVGKIYFVGNASDMDIILRGTTQLTMEGEGEDLDLELNGTSQFKGFKFAFNDVEVAANGNSLAEIWVQSHLSGIVNGSSTVRYKGLLSHSVSTNEAGKVVRVD